MSEIDKVREELDKAEASMWRAWIKEKKEQQEGKPWPKWMFAKDGEKRNE